MVMIKLNRTRHCRNNFILACGLLAISLSWCWFCPGRTDYKPKPKMYPIAEQLEQPASGLSGYDAWAALFLALQ